MNTGDLVKGQAWQPRGGQEFEWVQGELLPDGSPKYLSWIKTGDNEGRAVWAESVVLIAEAAPEEEATPRGAILREAETLITGDRNKNYGNPTENFDTTAALWNAQLGHKLKPGESFTATDVALLMVQLKMARLKTSTSKRDHYLDIAGYIACGWECQETEDASA